MKQAFEIGAVLVVVATALFFGFQLPRAATLGFWIIVGGPYVVLAGYAALRLHRDGELKELLRPSWGDFTKGFLGGAALFAGALVFSHVVTPHGSPRIAWLMRVYLQAGDPKDLRANMTLLGGAVLLLATAEELTWRGLVTRALGEKVGTHRAWVHAAVLYALVHVPTLFALGDARVGPNPTLVVAALFGGLVWGAMARFTRRLVPSILAHALFLWSVLVLFRLWGGGL